MGRDWPAVHTRNARKARALSDPAAASAAVALRRSPMLDKTRKPPPEAPAESPEVDTLHSAESLPARNTPSAPATRPQLPAHTTAATPPSAPSPDNTAAPRAENIAPAAAQPIHPSP